MLKIDNWYVLINIYKKQRLRSKGNFERLNGHDTMWTHPKEYIKSRKEIEEETKFMMRMVTTEWLEAFA